MLAEAPDPSGDFLRTTAELARATLTQSSALSIRISSTSKCSTKRLDSSIAPVLLEPLRTAE